MKITEELLKEFWRDANSYQSIDVGMFDIDDYAEEWLEKHQKQVENNGVLDDVIKCGCNEPILDTMDYDNFNCMRCGNEIKH